MEITTTYPFSKLKLSLSCFHQNLNIAPSSVSFGNKTTYPQDFIFRPKIWKLFRFNSTGFSLFSNLNDQIVDNNSSSSTETLQENDGSELPVQSR